MGTSLAPAVKEEKPQNKAISLPYAYVFLAFEIVLSMVLMERFKRYPLLNCFQAGSFSVNFVVDSLDELENKIYYVVCYKERTRKEFTRYDTTVQ